MKRGGREGRWGKGWGEKEGHPEGWEGGSEGGSPVCASPKGWKQCSSRGAVGSCCALKGLRGETSEELGLTGEGEGAGEGKERSGEARKEQGPGQGLHTGGHHGGPGFTGGWEARGEEVIGREQRGMCQGA